MTLKQTNQLVNSMPKASADKKVTAGLHIQKFVTKSEHLG